MQGYFIKTSLTSDKDRLLSLIENQSTFTFENSELHLFETHQQALNVELSFNDFALTSMLQGRKIMSVGSSNRFNYLPGESVIVPAQSTLKIDFPEATMQSPTKCLAISISKDIINRTINGLQERKPKAPNWGEWQLDPNLIHLTNTLELSDIIGRIINIAQNEQGRVKDYMLELTEQELLVRLMQTQARYIFSANYNALSTNNALASAIAFIKENLRSKINLDKVAEKGGMSRASFYKKFKESLGETPSQYILKERIKLAKHELKHQAASITQVCFSCGFENLSHFIRAFKNHEGITPRAWRNHATHGC